MRVLVTGIAGRIGHLVAQRLLTQGHEVVGIDARGWPDAPDAITLCQVDIRTRAAEDVFRRYRPEGVIHMATPAQVPPRPEERCRVSLSTRAVFDHCRYGPRAAAVVFVGRHTYYGAGPISPLYHREDDDPPMAVTSFPELADLVAADHYACTVLWRVPELRTVVLRICYALGPSWAGTLVAFLRGPRVPTVLGFDPLFQFMHERDVAAAICTTLEHEMRGVFNVSGPPPLPLSLLIRGTGRSAVPLPERLLPMALGRFGLPNLPPGALQHLKYPVVVDSAAFREATGFRFSFDEKQTMGAFRAGDETRPRA